MPSALRRTAEPPPHPRAGEPWFEALPTEKRAEFVAQWHASLARDTELARRDVRDRLRAPLPAAIVFALFDALSPHAHLLTVLGASVAGALVGFALHVLGFGRLRSTALGLLAFLAFEYATRGGFAGRVFFSAFVVGAAFAWIGWRREERGYD
jgi:hypothetical protein